MCADMEQESMEQERRRIHVCHMGRRICVLTWSNRTSRAIHQNAHTHTHTHTQGGCRHQSPEYRRRYPAPPCCQGGSLIYDIRDLIYDIRDLIYDIRDLTYNIRDP
jgi:hypothetical protein